MVHLTRPTYARRWASRSGQAHGGPAALRAGIPLPPSHPNGTTIARTGGFRMNLLLLAALLAQGAPPPAPAGPPPTAQMPTEGPAGWKERFDELWKKRDQPGAEKQLNAILKEQLAVDPGSFDANWRQA